MREATVSKTALFFVVGGGWVGEKEVGAAGPRFYICPHPTARQGGGRFRQPTATQGGGRV